MSQIVQLAPYPGVGLTFAPPLDIVNIPATEFAYGLRKLRSGYTGQCVRLRRSSDNAESDFGFKSTGDLNTAAITTWLAGANGFVRTWYDQSGNGRNATMTTTDNQPALIISGQNGKPVLRFDGSNDRLDVTAGDLAASQVTICAAGESDSAATGISTLMSAGDASAPTDFMVSLEVDASEDLLFVCEALPVLTATGTYSDTPGIFYGEATEGGDVNLYFNGSLLETDTNVAFSAATGSTAIGAVSGGDFLMGDMFEVYCWAIILITEIRESFEDNVNDYWSIY